MGTSSTDQRADTCQHALALAEQGLKIVLLGNAGTERAKIPRLKTWGTKATSDEDQIIELFESFPKANIGALLGPEGGIIDVEFDTPEGREKADELFKGVVTVAYESVRSVHRLFKWSDEMPAKQKIEVDGLEIRFGGGGKQTQSVLPPSIHPSGTPYKWLPGLSPMETDIAEMPYELLVRIVNGDDLKTTEANDFEPKSEEEWSKILDGVQEGGRNNAMATYVGGELRDMPDLDDQAALARKYKACEAINERNKPPMPSRDVRQTFLSILRKERNRRTSEGMPFLPSQSAKDNHGPPMLEITNDELKLNNQVLKNLGKVGPDCPWLSPEQQERSKPYDRNGQIVQVISRVDANKVETPVIRSVPPPNLGEIISSTSTFYVTKKVGGEVRRVTQRVPDRTIQAIYHRGDYAGYLPPLTAVATHPCIHRDGSLIQNPGYHRAAQLIYRPNCSYPPVPERPNREQARRAADELAEVYRDFPFRTDADLSAMLALPITAIVRNCIDSCCPKWAVMAETPGIGKSYFVDVSAMLAFGHGASRRTLSRDEAEQRKLLTAIYSEALPFVLFDNVPHELGGAPLDAALTARTWSDRQLGTSKMTPDLPADTIMVATGNNLRFTTDIARRLLPVRLHCDLESPEDRTSFTHPNLLEWVRENRPRLVVAALTIVRAFFVAGLPEQPGGAWGSFESWSRIVRGSLVWLGYADPLATRVATKANDETKELLSLLINGFREADPDNSGMTGRQIINVTSHRHDLEDGGRCPALSEAVAMICGDRLDTCRLGRRLRSLSGRIIDGHRLIAATAKGGVKRWSIEAVPTQVPTHTQITPELAR